MNIVILGAGEIGSYLASILSEEHHNVTLIDKNPNILEKISQKTDIATHSFKKYNYMTAVPKDCSVFIYAKFREHNIIINMLGKYQLP